MSTNGNAIEIKKVPQDLNDIGYFYWGFFAKSKDHRESMEQLTKLGWDWKFILSVRKWLRAELKKDGE